MKDALKSKTIWFSLAIMATGVLEQTTGLVAAVVPEDYKGVALAGVGLITALLRVVTTKPLNGE